MKIYTKTGDQGMTSLVGGKRVPKNSLRLEAYGNVDELNSYMGMLRSFPLEETREKEIINIQHKLFNIGSLLACDSCEFDLPQINEKDISFLEEAIDSMESILSPMKGFILPGGNKLVAFCHIARTVCRRTERRVLDMSGQEEVDNIILKYINRLSDYLFQLSRYIMKVENIDELIWNKEE